MILESPGSRINTVKIDRKKIDGVIRICYNLDMVKKSQIAATTRYEHKTYSKITVRLRQDGSQGITRDDVQEAADAVGLSINEYVVQAIKEKIDGGTPPGSPGELEHIPFYE